MNLLVLKMAFVSKTDIGRKIPKYFKFVKKMNLNVSSFPSSQNIFHDLKGPKVNIICTIDKCGDTFYGRYTAQHPAAVIRNNSKKFRSFKSKENIHKEVGQYHGFGY